MQGRNNKRYLLDNSEMEDFYNTLKTLIKNSLDIVDVISRYGGQVSSNHQHFLCENHSLTNDNFCKTNIYLDSNTAKCHACGEFYDVISYTQKKKGLAFGETLTYLCSEYNLTPDFGYVTDKNRQSAYINFFEKLTNRKYSFKATKNVSRVKPRIEIIEKRIATVIARDIIFSALSLGNSLAQGTKLSPRDKKYLLDRNLTEQEIEDMGLFTIPNQTIMPHLIKYLNKKYGFDENIFKDIPGFYKDENGKYTFRHFDGIGLPIKNATGRIEGLQVRLTNKPKNGSRYQWFSSKKLPGGTGSGAPLDVCYPDMVLKNEWTDNLFITEGKFKVQKLTKHTKSIGISVQGVGSWKGILEAMQQAQRLHKPFKNIFICFDGDLSVNAQVSEHAKKMSDAIKNGFPNTKIFYCIWDQKIGKGIDDVIDNNALNQVKIIHKKDYDNLYLSMVKAILTESNITIKSDINSLFSDFKFIFNKMPEEDRDRLFINHVYNKIPKKSA